MSLDSKIMQNLVLSTNNISSSFYGWCGGKPRLDRPQDVSLTMEKATRPLLCTSLTLYKHASLTQYSGEAFIVLTLKFKTIRKWWVTKVVEITRLVDTICVHHICKIQTCQREIKRNNKSRIAKFCISCIFCRFVW